MYVTDDMVSRFLTWPVPADVHPDGTPGQPGRTGTNLLTAAQAREMLTHVLGGLPAPTTREFCAAYPGTAAGIINEGLGALVDQLAVLARRQHTECLDPWYTCPAHPDGSADDSKPEGVCDCGADTHNAAVEALQARIFGMLQDHSAEAIGADRYCVKRTGLGWWRVSVGDGQQTVGRCFTRAEAERLAAALRTAFLDGAFVVEQHHARSG